ncbi:MAG: UDP-N-acetylmuramoyl-L-alanine--D-glutamate ligase, partial [Clostridiales bacterium]|nr:UDP-N-acetylmuramoyl-L-alanine--D-glutamate ligase [Clostridiales bacterium]
MELKESRVLVFGAGLSGIGAVRLLLHVPAAAVILYDGNEKLESEELLAKVKAVPDSSALGLSTGE